ncbi:hypothetical protein DFJ69_0858 [Thermomonospora umbrina]|uniref:Uncharacterized protein n=2 Tax=Thermomonospora umbrina TaxID=111806 RepID=A0A3D9SHS2_9ACTN|nr:hypothetical protein DFJ69_0858 [Thermomonospora umbrina]
MIADCLRRYARWRIGLVEEGDCGRNARSAVALINAADYVTTLDEHAGVMVRMAVAGCFKGDRFEPGAEGERIIRGWHYATGPAGPDQLLESLATAAERGAASPRRRTAGPQTAGL